MTGDWSSRKPPIHALSYAALRHVPQTRYLSTAGELNPDQPLFLEAEMRRLPSRGEVVLAMDHDAGGDKIGAKIEAVFATLSRADLSLDYDRLAAIGTDWNDELKAPASAIRWSPRIRRLRL